MDHPILSETPRVLLLKGATRSSFKVIPPALPDLLYDLQHHKLKEGKEHLLTVLSAVAVVLVIGV